MDVLQALGLICSRGPATSYSLVRRPLYERHKAELTIVVTLVVCRPTHKYVRLQHPLFGRRVNLIARRVGNVREVRSGCRAEPYPPTGAAPGRGCCLLSCSRCAQTVGLGSPGRLAGRSRRAPPFKPVSSWVPAALRTGRSRQCDDRWVKPPEPVRVMATPVSWDTTVGRAADSSLQRQPSGCWHFG
jgi:hypothetical protein